MNEVRINLLSTGWVTISEMTAGNGLTKLISLSSIVIAMNPSGIVENSSCTIVFENATGYFTALTAPDSPDRFLRGCDIEIYQQGELTFRGKISETPKPTSSLVFEIKADIYVNFDREINLQLNKRTLPAASAIASTNKNKYGNIITGEMTENQEVVAYRFAENMYLAAWHYLYAITAAKNDQEVDITSQCTLIRDAFTGHTYIEYEGTENEIYIQASGGYDVEYDETNLIQNGSMEIWNSNIDLQEWTELIGGESTVTREATIVYSGNYSTKITTDTAGIRVGIEIPLTLDANTHYRLRIAYLIGEAGKTITVVLKNTPTDMYLLSTGLWCEWDQDNLDMIEIEHNTSGWAIFEIEFRTPDETDYMLLIRRTYPQKDYTFYLDSIEIHKEKSRKLILNPADMFHCICRHFSTFSIDTNSIDVARSIYKDRNYEGNCIVISDNLKWKDFFRKFFENFETYIDTSRNISLIVPNLGLETAQASINPIYIDWARFLFWYDYPQVWGSILTHFEYSPKKNTYAQNLETMFNESGHSGEKKELFLCYHNNVNSSSDIAGKYAYRRQNPPIRYEFRVPEIIGKGIHPGQIIQLEAMRKGFFLGDNRLCFVHRKRKEKSNDAVFFVFVCEDITILSERVLILRDENSENCETLKDQDDPECHLLL